MALFALRTTALFIGAIISLAGWIFASNDIAHRRAVAVTATFTRSPLTDYGNALLRPAFFHSKGDSEDGCPWPQASLWTVEKHCPLQHILFGAHASSMTHAPSSAIPGLESTHS